MLKKLTGKPPADSSITAVFCVKNEMRRLPFFFDYYRKLGVKEFFAVDNNSDDGTLDYLLKQDDVQVFWTDKSYKESNAGRDWTDEVTRRYCNDKWCLTLDVDEFFVYPFSEYISLDVLCDYLDKNGYQGIFCIFLDHYSDTLLSNTHYNQGDDVFTVCPYHDSPKNYFAFQNENFPFVQIKGGIRQRFFWDNGRKHSGPAQRKIPLVKNSNGFYYLYSTHSCMPIRLADITGVLAHFKFFSEFHTFVDREVNGGDRKNPQDYQKYLQGVKDVSVVFFDEKCSQKFENSFGYILNDIMACSMEAFDYFFHHLCRVDYDKYNPIRIEFRNKLANKLKDNYVTYDNVIKLWSAISKIQPNQYPSVRHIKKSTKARPYSTQLMSTTGESYLKSAAGDPYSTGVESYQAADSPYHLQSTTHPFMAGMPAHKALNRQIPGNVILLSDDGDMHAHILRASRYKSFMITEKIRRFLYRQGIIDKMNIVEDLPNSSYSNREKVKYMYESVWWDLTAPYRLFARAFKAISNKIKKPFSRA